MKKSILFLAISFSIFSCSSDSNKSESNDSDSNADSTSTIQEVERPEEMTYQEFTEKFDNRISNRNYNIDKRFFDYRDFGSWEVKDKGWIDKLGLTDEYENGMRFSRYVANSRKPIFTLIHSKNFSVKDDNKEPKEVWYYLMEKDSSKLKYKVKLGELYWNEEKQEWKAIKADKLSEMNAIMIYEAEPFENEAPTRRIVHLGLNEAITEDLKSMDAFLFDLEEDESTQPICTFSPTCSNEETSEFVMTTNVGYEFYEFPEMSFYVKANKLGMRYRLYYIDYEDENYENVIVAIDQIPGGMELNKKIQQPDSISENEYKFYTSYKNSGIASFKINQDIREFDKISFHYKGLKNDDGKIEYEVTNVIKLD